MVTEQSSIRSTVPARRWTSTNGCTKLWVFGRPVPLSPRTETRMPNLRWRRDHDHEPARVYVCGPDNETPGPFNIIWDPAGRTEDECGGWWLKSDSDVLGIFPTLREAKAAAQV